MDSNICYDKLSSRIFRCSVCDFGIEDIFFTFEDSRFDIRYCPNCGRKIVYDDFIQ